MVGAYTCPVCLTHKTLSIYEDPRGGHWFHCSRCRHSGDPLETYALLRNAPLKNAVYELLEDTKVFPQVKPDPQAVDDYAQEVETRKKILALWEKLQDSICGVDMDPAVLNLAATYKVWQGYFPDWWKSRGRYLLGGIPPELLGAVHDLFEEPPRYYFPRKAVLAMPVFDLPGRITGLNLMTGKTSFIAGKVWPYGKPEDIDAGLIFRHTVNHDTDTVFAIPSALAALHLHLKRLTWSDTPIPLVAWSRKTSASWASLRSKHVIFWSPFPDDEDMLRQALALPKARIGRYRVQGELFSNPENLYQMFRDGPEARWLSAWESSAKPPLEYLKDIALKKPESATALVARLGLRPTQIEELLDLATVREKEVLRRVLKASRAGRVFEFNGVRFVEDEDGYYTASQTRPGILECVSNTRIEVTRLVRRPNTARTIVYGQLHVGTRSVNFAEDEEKLVDNRVMTWARGKALEAGLDIPQAYSKYARDIYAMGLQASKPDVAVLTDTPVFDDKRQAYTFPGLRVENGAITRLEVGSGAFSGLCDKQLSEINAEYSAGDELAAWTFTAVFLRALLAPMYAWDTLPVLYVAQAKDALFARISAATSLTAAPGGDPSRLLSLAAPANASDWSRLFSGTPAALLAPMPPVLLPVVKLNRSALVLDRPPTAARPDKIPLSAIPWFLAYCQLARKPLSGTDTFAAVVRGLAAANPARGALLSQILESVLFNPEGAEPPEKTVLGVLKEAVANHTASAEVEGEYVNVVWTGIQPAIRGTRIRVDQAVLTGPLATAGWLGPGRRRGDIRIKKKVWDGR